MHNHQPQFETYSAGKDCQGLCGLTANGCCATTALNVVFRGDYAAVTDYESLDMSVLRRDVLDMFALIVDRRGGTIAVIGGAQGYAITQEPP